MLPVKNWTSKESEKISLGISGGKVPETFCNYTLSTFNLRQFSTTLRGLEKDDFCTYKDNGNWHFEFLILSVSNTLKWFKISKTKISSS